MTATPYIVFGFVGLGIVIGLIWRMPSRRHMLHRPSWLGRMIELDNPFTKARNSLALVQLAMNSESHE